MKESYFWSAHVKKWLDAQDDVDYSRHEDEVSTGIPDVSYSWKKGKNRGHGWIELKAYHQWPKRASTTIKFDNFTSAQRNFLFDRGEIGGSCFLMACIERDVLVFEWGDVYELGEWNKEQLFKYSAFRCTLPISGELSDTLFVN